MEQIPGAEQEKIRIPNVLSLLDSLDVAYTLEEEPGTLAIVIAPPEEHAEEKAVQRKNQEAASMTSFEWEKIHPIVNMIEASAKYQCEVESNDDRITISVSRK